MGSILDTQSIHFSHLWGWFGSFWVIVRSFSHEKLKFLVFLEQIFWYFSLFYLLILTSIVSLITLLALFELGSSILLCESIDFRGFPLSLLFSQFQSLFLSPSPHYYPITFDLNNPDLHLSRFIPTQIRSKPKNNLERLDLILISDFFKGRCSVFSLIEKGKWSGETMDEEVLIERLPIMTHRLILRCSNWYSTTELDSTGL